MEVVFPTILKEEWATARLADGTVIRNRPVLFFGLADPSKKGMGVKTGATTVVWAPEKGKPDPMLRTLQDLEKIARDPIEPRMLEEGTCMYQFPKGDLLILRHRINKVRPTATFDKDGEPQFVINYGTEITILNHGDGEEGLPAKK